MTRLKSDGNKEIVLGGWPQFTTQKSKMVSDFKSAGDMSENRPTDTDKGKYAEALFRDWLEQFIPAKYGVTSGYIMMSLFITGWIRLSYGLRRVRTIRPQEEYGLFRQNMFTECSK